MKSTVLAALGMAWAWGVIAGGVGLNALIKSNQEKSRLRALVPSPTVLTIDTNDVFSSGVVVTTVSALIAVICTLTIIHIVFFPASSRIDRIHGIMLAFCAVWLFVTMIPFTAFVANRSADVTATLNGVALPSSLIDRAERTLGVTRVYKDISYLRLVAILPWFTVLFTAIAAGVLFTASSRATATTETHIEEAPKSPTDSDTHATIEKE